MEKVRFDYRMIFFCLLLFGLIFVTFYVGYQVKSVTSDLINDKVKTGQIWVREDSRDPFRSPRFDTIEVLEVKGNYSLVLWNGDTTSMENELVTCCGKRLMENVEK